MYFNKYPYRSNFEFLKSGKLTGSAGDFNATFKAVEFNPKSDTPYGEQEISLECTRYEGDVYYLKISSQRWSCNHAQSDLAFPEKSASGQTNLEIDKDFNITLSDDSGNILLQSFDDKGFGICGNESIYIFKRDSADRFYGMGEKGGPLEKSGVKTKFWNTDVFADFSKREIYDGKPDPLYVSIPYLIVKHGSSYIGLLLDNPYATFIDTDGKVNIANQMDAKEQPQDTLSLGSEHGQPNLIIVYGPSLHELTCKIQKIIGTTPLPPAWSLGYHQCRWGYKSYADVKYIDAAMNKFEIPCDGIWLDIEYMRGYRIFTFEEEKYFPNPEENIKDIQDGGRRIIPIIDPGVKAERGFDVYESGHEADVFCKNPQGQEFIGLVWPGETVFPDYSIKKGRCWWTEQVKAFADRGITGAWLDMNDPSVGSANCCDMLFDDGKKSHYTYHNQYALGMAQASRAGFAAAYPEDRPFLLCRSGFTGSNKYTAIWTGDNVSNYHHLQTAIPTTLNLALSGIPFNGPDVGGFDGNTTQQLMTDWTKAGFLFPFFRNHSVVWSEDQEPWMFDRATLDILRHYIRMRYHLRPYLYNLFADHEETGAAIMRPLFYEFEESKALPLDRINDQFMVGETIMQAPFVTEDQEREVVLPDAEWFSPMDGKWLAGNRKITVKKADRTTPIFFRQGGIIPMVPEVEGENKFDSTKIRFHLFFNSTTDQENEYTYIYDDGQTFGYQNGKRSRMKVAVKSVNGSLEITTEQLEDGFGKCTCDFVLYDDFKQVTVNGKTATPESISMELTGCQLQLSLV